MIDTWYLCVSYRIIDSSNNDSYLSDVESLTADKSWYRTNDSISDDYQWRIATTNS